MILSDLDLFKYKAVAWFIDMYEHVWDEMDRWCETLHVMKPKSGTRLFPGLKYSKTRKNKKLLPVYSTNKTEI